MYETGRPRPSSLFVMREETSWTLRLTQQRNLHHGRTVILSSTLTPTQFLLSYGQVAGVRVIEPQLSQREKRILVADHQLGSEKLVGVVRPDKALRERLFETASRLIEQERERTGLPVVLLGRGRVLTAFLRSVLGHLPSDLEMPFKTDRADRMARLRVLTEPHGILAGYAGGVSGSNEFQVGGRFVRSAIVLGGILPRLDQFEAEWRGAFSWFPFSERRGSENDFAVSVPIDRCVDWTVVPRPVAIDGTTLGEGADATVQVAANVFGYADPAANEVLRHAFEDELVQMVGRMRGCIPDPEGVEARAYVLGHIAIPGWPVDEVVGLDDLRERVGLQREPTGRTGPKRSNGPEVVAKRVAKFGRAPTLVWLIEGLVKGGYRADFRRSTAADVVAGASQLLEGAGQRPLTDEEMVRGADLARSLLNGR